MSPWRISPAEGLPANSLRAYAPPARSWSVTQRWNDLLFAHWPVPVSQIAPLLPPGLEPDTFDASAWLGVVPFWMDRVQIRGVARIPGVSRFPELNLRTYVRERNTNRGGVYSFSLEASNPLAVLFAKSFFHLPYHWARISVSPCEERGFTCQSERLLSSPPVRFRAHYRGLGSMREPCRQGTIEYFLAERYCLFTVDRSGQLLRGEIHHTPWLLEGAEAEFEFNDLPAAHGIRLPDAKPLLHYARQLVVYLWSLDHAPWSALPSLEAVGARTAEIV